MTPDTLTAQMMRLEDAWGAPRDRTPAQFVGMTREWFLQLQRFGSNTVERAITHVIGTHKFGWPSVLPEIVMYCTKDDRDWREIVSYDARQLAPPAEQFEHDGRSVEEEIQHRANMIAEMKRATGFGTAEDPLSDMRKKIEPKQASLDVSVGAHLLNTCASRRARKLATCHENCSRKACELRERETVQ